MDRQQIFEQIKAKRSFLCVGLDTDITKIPTHLLGYDDPLFEFNKQVIDATAQYTVAYKPNFAFYESAGINGLAALAKTANYVKDKYPEIFLIADAKRGDIGNTAKMYAKAVFEHMPFDAVTVAPYMGEDSVTPFLGYKDKWVILLGLTSNKGADDFQFIGNPPLYQQVLKKSQYWASVNELMFVAGATRADMLKEVRKLAPDNFLLVPGIGAQGGSLADVAKYGMNNKCGLLVNSSRAIIYADNSRNFDIAAQNSAHDVQNQMQLLLAQYCKGCAL